MSLKKILALTPALVAIVFPAVAAAQGWTTGQVNVASSNLPVSSAYGTIANTLSWLLAVLGFIAVMGFVISGLQYLLAAGDEGMAERAKNAMKFSIIGVIVALMGYVVIRAINAWLGASAAF